MVGYLKTVPWGKKARGDLVLMVVVRNFLGRVLWRWCVGSGPSLSPYEKVSHSSQII